MRINVYGDIVNNDDAWIYDYFSMDCSCPARVTAALQEAGGQPVDVYINSGGGDIFAGSEIYSAIRGYTGKVTLHVVGLAASAASVIACAGRCLISPTAMMMVHNVSATANGDCHDMDKTAETLRKANSAIAAAYVAKTGMTEEEALAMMDHETWITAKEAVAHKLAVAWKRRQTSQSRWLHPRHGVKALKQCRISAILSNLRQRSKAQAEINILKLKGEHNETD